MYLSGRLATSYKRCTEMGNRCLIATTKKDLAVYLHWNGGIESVAPFLKYCELQGHRSPESDSYGWARLCQVIGNFFGGSNSIGISKYYESTEDNGTYFIKNWRVIGREFNNMERMNAMLKDIDSRQPVESQLGEFLDSSEVLISDLKVNDQVFVFSGEGYKKLTVVGFGIDKVVNGTNVKGLPIVSLFERDGKYDHNINNYITTETAHRAN